MRMSVYSSEACVTDSTGNTLYPTVRAYPLLIPLLVLEIICSVCGACLYSGLELKPIREVLVSKNGRLVCRHCGAELSTIDFTIDVTKAF